MSDLIDRQAVINTEGLDEQIRCEMCRNPMRTDRGCDGNCKYDERLYERIMQILGERINPLSSVQPEPCSDAISRQAAIRWVKTECNPYGKPTLDFESGKRVMEHLKTMPSVQPEPLTDKEQRIFLAAMGREEKVCEEVDRNHIREPYEDSLMWICREIKRKVKGALWT